MRTEHRLLFRLDAEVVRAIDMRVYRGKRGGPRVPAARVIDVWIGAGGYGVGMPDVITTIEADHREVERLFAAYATATSPDEKDGLVDQIRLALAPHAAAEEILVYPAVRGASGEGDEQASHSIDEHQEIKRLLSEVDHMSATDPGRDQKVRELEQAVAHHVEEEEGEVLPSLRAGVTAERLEQMGELFSTMKPLLPTHPHPLVPGTASAQLLAGPLASVADRIRDLLAR